MKKLKFVMLALITCSLFGCADNNVSSKSENFSVEEIQTYDDLNLTLINGEYVIVGVNNRDIKEVEIPASYDGKPIVSIGKSAFFVCSSLTSIIIPNSVKTIGANAFSGCSALESITIPNSVTSIGNWAFSNCSNLQNVNFESKSTLENIGEWSFSNCSSLTSVIIPDGVKSIDEFAFYSCSSLTSIAIPNSVANIGYKAFHDCNMLNIYCEATSKPDGWDNKWNFLNRPVYWGNEWHVENGLPTLN